jgi:hypothetical protein
MKAKKLAAEAAKAANNINAPVGLTSHEEIV